MDTLGSMAVHAEDEPTAQHELQRILAEATRKFQALYSRDYGVENRRIKDKMDALRADVSFSNSVFLCTHEVVWHAQEILHVNVCH